MITFIKSLADSSNLPWIAQQVFRSEEVDLAEITEKLKEAVQHYSSLAQAEQPAPQSPGIAPGMVAFIFSFNWRLSNNDKLDLCECYMYELPSRHMLYESCILRVIGFRLNNIHVYTVCFLFTGRKQNEHQYQKMWQHWQQHQFVPKPTTPQQKGSVSTAVVELFPN